MKRLRHLSTTSSSGTNSSATSRQNIANFNQTCHTAVSDDYSSIRFLTFLPPQSQEMDDVDVNTAAE
ncbi:hypothetical protein Slin14017_G126910 [Septoria linicola]|nr:hypothetical protein Slin14017_G126910 [Septoria linicola]